MTGKTGLIVGSHAHLTPSAGDGEFEDLYKTRLKPFLTALNQHPSIQAALHYSGPLYGRIEQKKPELLLLLRELVARKQLEILGGGFYEPILTLIPPADRIGQIETLTTYIRQNFGRKPQGCWLAHGSWEQSLVGYLNTCGMAYTFLQEEQFIAAGRSGAELYTPVLTEDQGKIAVVFPVFSSLGKEKRFSVLQNMPQDAAGVVTVFPEFGNGDPAGAEAEANGFFAGLAAALAERPDIETTTPGKVYRNCGTLPRAYFPAGSDLPGGRPRAFLTRYQEASDLYSRIFFTHSLISQLRGDKSRKQAAREELWKAQGAEALCRSGSRDLSSSAVRKYSYRAILGAERIIREKAFKPSLLSFDFNLDRTPEYLFQDKNINCYVRTRGASVFELDYLAKGWNYLDTFAGEQGPSSRRCAFMDRLLPAGYIPAGSSFPAGRFCGDEDYSLESIDRQKLKAAFVLPPKKNLPFGNIEIQKAYKLEKNVLTLSYALVNRGEEKTMFCFVPQFDLSLAGEQLLFRKTQGEEELRREPGELKRILSLEEEDPRHGMALSLSFQMPCDIHYYAVESPGGCQSLCFLPVFQLFLHPGGGWENKITVTVTAAKAKKQAP